MIFGQNLSASPQFCFTEPVSWPTVVPPCNAMVLINGEAAPIGSNSTGQIFFQFPFEETPGPAGPPGPVEIIVDVAGVRSEPVMVELQRFAPAFSTLPGTGGTEIGAFVGQTQELITEENPAVPGDILSGFAVGLGPTDPPVPAGTAATGTVVVPPKVLIHGAAKAVREAQVLGAALGPGFVQDFLFGRPGTYTIADYRLRCNGFRTAARFGTPFAAAPAFECWPIMAFQRSQRAL